jgi:hypothetical protein
VPHSTGELGNPHGCWAMSGSTYLSQKGAQTCRQLVVVAQWPLRQGRKGNLTRRRAPVGVGNGTTLLVVWLRQLLPISHIPIPHVPVPRGVWTGSTGSSLSATALSSNALMAAATSAS